LNLQQIKSFCSKLERELITLEAERKTLQTLLEEQESKIKVLEVDKELNKKANIFIRQIAQETRLNAISSIEELVTAWSRDMYSQDYTFTMEMKEISQKESENTSQFTISPTLEKIIDGELVKRPLRGTSGGGLHEIISYILRIAFGTYNGYTGAYFLDEAFSAVSKDGVMKYLLKFMKKYNTELGLQNILITHSPEKFALISSKNYLVYKENGIAKVKETSLEEIKDMQNFDLIEIEDEDS
jgi:predicted ATPase